MATLSNNPFIATDEALHRNHIAQYFERTFSIDDQVKPYKPSPEGYLAVAAALGVTPDKLCVISCHAFDILGAGAVGLYTAMILRPGNATVALGLSPNLVARDLQEMADYFFSR